MKRLSVHTVLGQGVVERQRYTQCTDGRQNIHTVHVGGQGGRMHAHLNMADIKGRDWHNVLSLWGGTG